MIVVLDFGGQYCHLIARRIRDLGVYSEIFPYDIDLKIIKEISPNGIILSGGPGSVYEKGSPKLSEEFYDFVRENKIPVLGICYGFHLVIHQLGGRTEPHDQKEYGRTEIKIVKSKGLLESLKKSEIVWMSHGDQVKEMPSGFEVLAKTDTCPIAAYQNEELKIYGVQFHPEVVHTPKGNIILENFIIKITNAKKQWKLEDWVQEAIK
ncbi:MAG: glutamine-hydrolyzing GMP synthase, partial [Promethearchaeota archaeon]